MTKKKSVLQKFKDLKKDSKLPPIRVEMTKIDEKDQKTSFSIETKDSMQVIFLDLIQCLDLGAEKMAMFRERISKL